MEKFILKTLKVISTTFTVIFIALGYGTYNPVSWAASLAMAVASVSLILLPEELF